MLSLKQSLVQKLLQELAEQIDWLTGKAPSVGDRVTPMLGGDPAMAPDDPVGDLERMVQSFRQLPLRMFKPDEAIDLSALIEVNLEGHKLHCFLAAEGGGMKVDLYGREIQVITAQSPLGKALVGRCAGEVVEVPVTGGHRRYEIMSVI